MPCLPSHPRAFFIVSQFLMPKIVTGLVFVIPRSHSAAGTGQAGFDRSPPHLCHFWPTSAMVLQQLQEIAPAAEALLERRDVVRLLGRASQRGHPGHELCGFGVSRIATDIRKVL